MLRKFTKCLLAAVSVSILGIISCSIADDLPPRQQTVPLKSASRSFHYGVQAHMQRWPKDQEKLFDIIDQLGCDIVRAGSSWNDVEKVEGTFDFSRFDKTLLLAESHGLELQSILGFTALWASTSNAPEKDWQNRQFSAPKLEPFTRYVDAVGRRYAGRIKYWEIWNEPEIAFWRSTPAEYVATFNAAAATMAKADPSAKVMNGGFAMEKRPPNMTFLEDFITGADQTHWGIWAYHDYNTLNQLIARAKATAKARSSVGATMPVWINEGGFNTINRGGGEAEQAITLAKKLSVAPSLGAKAYIWYDLIDDGIDPNDKEHHFGLVRRDFSFKPAFYAYQHLIRELSPCTFDHRLAESAELSGVWGLVYKANSADTDNVLVLWREGKGRQTPLWISGGEGGTATGVFAIDGKPIEAPQLASGVLVNVTDTPMYVHLRGSLSPALKPVLSLPDKLAVLPGEPGALKIDLVNPTNNAQDFAITAHADLPQIQAAAPAGMVRLAPGEQKSVSLNVTVPADVAASHHSGIVTAGLRLSDGGPELEATLPYQVAEVIPRLAAPADQVGEGQGLTLNLKDREHIVNMFTAEPAPKMQYRGPEDLSGVANLAWSDDALYVRIAVTDDKHVQSYHAAETWRSDSLQLAIRCDDSAATYFECNLALGNDGKTGGWINTTPPNSPLALGVLEKPIDATVRRDGTQTIYQLRMPWKAFGIDKPPASGLRLNFIVNDDDGDGRKGWLQLSDGIGLAKDPNLFKVFVCK